MAAAIGSAASCVGANGVASATAAGPLVFAGVGATFVVVLAAVRGAMAVAPRRGAGPNWGIGAHAVIALLCSTGMLLTLPRVVLFYVFIARPADDAKASEFACQLAPLSIGTLIIALFLLLMVGLMMAFNALRSRTRHTLATVLAPYLVPADGGGGPSPAKPVLLVLPAFRGTWVTPLARAFAAAAEVRATTADVIALDAYGTALCPESDAWMRHNLAAEGADGLVRVGWTSFVKLPLPDHSVDVVAMPMGTRAAYLNNNRDSAKRKGEKLAGLLAEVRRVLRPRGRLLYTAMGSDGGTWLAALRDAGFAAADVTTLPTRIWASFMPSSVVVAVAPAAETREAAAHEAAAAARAAALSHLSLDAPGTVELESYALFPPGRQYRARDAVVAVFLTLYAAYVVLAYYTLDSLLVPSWLPWGTSLAALFVGNSTSWPIALYFVAVDLTRVARGETEVDDAREAAVRDRRSMSRMPSTLRLDGGVSGGDGSASAAPVREEVKLPLLQGDATTTARAHGVALSLRSRLAAEVEARRTAAVWRAFLKELRGFLLGFTVLAVVLWLPLFVFQAIVCKAGGVTDFGTLNHYGDIFTPVFYMVLVPLVRRVYARVAAWREASLAKLEAEEDALEAAAAGGAPAVAP